MKRIILIISMLTVTHVMANSFNDNRLTVQQHDYLKYKYALRASARGNVNAQFDLGIMYATGRGVLRNEQLAFKYFHKAARKNHIKAKFFMGLSFAQGRGVRQQPELAKYWFTQAVKAGHKDAKQHLYALEQSLRPQQGRVQMVDFQYLR